MKKNLITKNKSINHFKKIDQKALVTIKGGTSGGNIGGSSAIIIRGVTS